jgi:hypothetical protein
MDDFILSSVGTSFKKWGVVHPFFQNARPILIIQKIKIKIIKKIICQNCKNRGVSLQSVKLQAVAGRRPLVTGQSRAPNYRPATHRCPKQPAPKKILLPPTYIFLYMWSTLASWLQHMPTLPKLLLKFSNIHNF